MPNKCLTPGPLVHLARSSPDPTSLAQCARRRLQYSQLPVRCSSRRSSHMQQQRGKLASSLKKFPILGTPKRCVSAKSCTSAKSCCPEDGAARFLAAAAGDAKSPAARKSLSMTDLFHATPGAKEFEPADLRSDSGTSSARLDDGSSDHRSDALSLEGCAVMTWPVSRQEERESRAASIIGRALAVNAWRRRREEIVDLSQQLDQLQLQINVLRRLHDNENGRVAILAGELHKAKAQLEDANKERDQLKIEKETAEGEATRQREIAEERSVDAENALNELRSTRDQLEALDRQMAKDREKLLKLREDNKILLDKVAESEAFVEKAELSLAEMQAQLATQMAVTASLPEELERITNLLNEKEEEKSQVEKMLRKMEEENMKLEERLQVAEETEKELSLRAAELTNHIINQESKIKRIEAAYSAQALELNELRDRLFRESRDCGWSSKILQLAGSMVRAPGAILRTLSFFTTGMPLVL